MSFERLKDYLSGVTFEISLAKGYIHPGTTADHSTHRYTIKGAENGQRIYFAFSMQVTTGFDLRFADHVSRLRKQNDVSKNGDGSQVIS